MKIRFTSGAFLQLNLLFKSGSTGTGFILGRDIGQYKIIDNLITLPFNRRNIEHLYEKIRDTVGENLAGVFFANGEPFLNDWFIEDVVLDINGDKAEFFSCGFDGTSRRKNLVKIFDVEEHKSDQEFYK